MGESPVAEADTAEPALEGEREEDSEQPETPQPEIEEIAELLGDDLTTNLG